MFLIYLPKRGSYPRYTQLEKKHLPTGRCAAGFAQSCLQTNNKPFLFQAALRCPFETAKPETLTQGSWVLEGTSLARGNQGFLQSRFRSCRPKQPPLLLTLVPPHSNTTRCSNEDKAFCLTSGNLSPSLIRTPSHSTNLL